MTPRAEIINRKVVTWVQLLACFLKKGDVFRRPRGRTQYKFKELVPDQGIVICLNMVTHLSEKIYYNSPVFKLVII